MYGGCQAKIQDVVVFGQDCAWNSGTAIAVYLGMRRKVEDVNPLDTNEKARNARVSFRSVFPVDGARLAIGHFNRPLADDECRKLPTAWEGSLLQGVEDFEVTSKQVSCVTPPPRVDATWESIDALLAGVPLTKAS